MSWNNNSRNDDRKDDKPPYSRLFIVCSKGMREDALRPHFEKYGVIEDLYMPKDRNTRESRGVAYVKYEKTSSAAAAIRELHMNVLEGSGQNKPIKVMVASNKNDKVDNSKEEKHNRLFIKVSKQATDSDIRQDFSEFGQVESVHIQKDRSTDESKGLAYVQFSTFYETAKAFEECDKKYKAVFATPKQELKRGYDSTDLNDSYHSNNSGYGRRDYNDSYNYTPRDESFRERDRGVGSLIHTIPQSYTSVLVACRPDVPQHCIERLFNIVPGMTEFQYQVDKFNGYSKAMVTYEDERAAVHAVEALNNYEFPSGEVICVKPNNPLSKAANDLTSLVNSFKNAVDSGTPDLVQLADAIAQASTLIKAATTGDSHESNPSSNYCSVPLPPPQPMASINARVALRCFVVCKPHPPSNNVLKDVFRRFGDLIDLSTFPNKTFGFAKYASVKSAREAIHTLDGAMVCGVRIKVTEADERPPRDDKMHVDTDDVTVDNAERKRKKLHDEGLADMCT